MRFEWLLLLPIVVAASSASVAEGRPFVVEKAANRKLEQRVRLRGQVNHRTSARIESAFSANIKRFAVNVGDVVKAGDVIAEAETSFENGFLVFQDQSVKIDERRVDMAKFSLDFERRGYDRDAKLVEKGLAPPSQLDKSHAQVEAARASLDSALATLQKSKAQREEWQERVKKASYHSPLDGRVVEMGVNPKQVVGSYRASSPFMIARVAKPGSYFVRARALETQRNRISPTDKCQVYIFGRKAPVKCRVTSIPEVTVAADDKKGQWNGGAAPQSASITGYEIEAEFDLETELPPNLEAELVLSRPIAKGLSVPLDAISARSDGDFVDTATERADGQLEWHTERVTVKECGDVHAIIDGKLKSGDRVRVWL